MPNPTNPSPFDTRHVLLRAAHTATRALLFCLLGACTSTDDDSPRTGSESHFVRCDEMVTCEVGVCSNGFCEVDGERVTVDALDDDPASGEDASTDDSGVPQSGGQSAADNPEGGATTSPTDSGADPASAQASGNDTESAASESAESTAEDSGASTLPPTDAGAAAGETSESAETSTPVEATDPTEDPAITTATLTPCPEATPADATPCDEVGIECTYGSDPRGVRCRTSAVCTFNGWQVETPSCSPLVDLGECSLPSAELHGTACELGAHCSNAGSRCQCGECYVYSIELCEGGECSDYSEIRCQDTPVWHCDSQVQTGCPSDSPNLGAGCDATHPYCYYFDPVCGTSTGTGCFLGRISPTSSEPLGYGEECAGRAIELEQYCPAEPPEDEAPCSTGFRDPPALACDYGACERYVCNGQLWRGGTLNEPECTDCGLLAAACDADTPCCNGFFCQAGACASLQVCGNGVVDPTETCDDDNLESGDGCSADCQVETAF